MRISQRSNIFSSYVLSGRQWPQTRWANVIVLLNDIGRQGNSTITTPNLKNFFAYKLSTTELKALRNIMNHEHINAGINIKFVSDDMLECEFIKAQIGVQRVVDAFLNNNVPTHFKESNLDRIKAQYEELQYFQNDISTEHGAKLYEILNICKLELKQHKELAKIFRATYFTGEVRQNMLDSYEYINLFKSYGIDFTPKTYDAHATRRQIIDKIFHHIKTAVNDQHPNIQPFFIYN